MSHPQAYLRDSEIIAATPSLRSAPLAALAGEDGLIVTELPGIGMLAARTVDGFTHVIALPDGMRGIELWDAPHWREGGTFLEALDDLEPAPLDLEPLADAPRGVAEELLDAVLAGDRVVLVEPDERRRIAWIAWVSYALPRPLTFASFRTADVDLCAVASGDGLDATRESTAQPSLYARVAAELARRGTLTATQLDDTDAVALAVAGSATDLLTPTDLPRALELITDLASRGEVTTAARAAASLGALPELESPPVAAPDEPDAGPAAAEPEVDSAPDEALVQEPEADSSPAVAEPDEPMSLAELEAMVASAPPVEPAASPDIPVALSELDALLTTDEVPMSLSELESWLGGQPMSLADLEAALGDDPAQVPELVASDDAAESVSPAELEASLDDDPAAARDDPTPGPDGTVQEASGVAAAPGDERAAAWRDADRDALDAWLALHAVARRLPAGEDSRALAEAALEHVLPFAAALPDDVPFVGAHAPTKPGAAVLQPWLAAVEAHAGTDGGAALLANGVELGLLGVDPLVDERAGDVLADHFESVPLAIEGIARQALLDPLTTRVTKRLADAVAAEPDKRRLLRDYCRHQAAFAALGALAPNHPSLAVMSTYLWALVDREPERRVSAARTLLMLDASAGADVRALWGDAGPSTKDEHAELLGVYHDAERPPPDPDVERALHALMEAPLSEADKGDPLALALRALPDHNEEPAYCAWYAAARPPGDRYGLGQWSQVATRALYSRVEDVPAERKAELLELATEQLIEPKTLDGYFDALERLREATGPERFARALAHALEQRLEVAEDPTELLAVTFSIFAKAPAGGQELHDQVLAPAARQYRRQDDEVRAHLGPRRQAEWDAWAARHKRPRFARRRRFARRGR